MKKKALLIVVAMILICALSITGTVAFLKKEAKPVTNTFIAGAPDDDTFLKSLTLEEKKVTANDFGEMKESEEWVGSNTYNNVLPGTTLPKTIKVTAAGKNQTPGYLYVEIVNTLDAGVFTWEIDDTKWKNLGIEGRNVYVYCEDNTPVIVTSNVTVEGVLKGNKVTVKDVADLKLTETTKTMKVYAYMTQATVAVNGANTSNAKDVFTAIFPNAPTT